MSRSTAQSKQGEGEKLIGSLDMVPSPHLNSRAVKPLVPWILKGICVVGWLWYVRVCMCQSKIFLPLRLLFKVFSCLHTLVLEKMLLLRVGDTFRGIYNCSHPYTGLFQGTCGNVSISGVAPLLLHRCRSRLWMERELGEVVLGADDTDTQETWLKNLSNSLPVCELYDISFSTPAKMWAY